MAVSRLSGRLARIRASQTNAHFAETGFDGTTGSTSDAEPAASDAPVALSGWEITAPFLFERVTHVPVSGYRDTLSTHLPLLFPREREELFLMLPRKDLMESLVFFDLETTGLSHGAGTVAFMAGIARFTAAGGGKPPDLRIHQILLGDYPGEPAFLQRFSELVGDTPVFVSFNGKCFDSQILFTRYLMNGLKPSFLAQGATHLDLLFPSRRLWKKKLGSCRLSVIENEILGVTRVDDLPGSEAPEAWFDYVKAGITGRLLAIGDHNRTDCESLARLLFSLDGAIETGEGRASLIRALDLRAKKEWESSSALLGALASEGDALALKILAIDAEHRIRDLGRALSYAELLGDENRKKRIMKKLEKTRA